MVLWLLMFLEEEEAVAPLRSSCSEKTTNNLRCRRPSRRTNNDLLCRCCPLSSSSCFWIETIFSRTTALRMAPGCYCCCGGDGSVSTVLLLVLVLSCHADHTMHGGVVVVLAVEQRKIRPVLVLDVRNISLAFVIVERGRTRMPWNVEMWREGRHSGATVERDRGFRWSTDEGTMDV